MSILSKIIVAVVTLIAVLVVVGFFLPRDVHVEREIVIDAPQATVFALVNGYSRFNEWSPWAAKDPDTRYVYEGPTHGVGAIQSWESDDRNVGSGRQEIVASTPHEEVRTALDFGDQGTADALFRLSPIDGGTRVVWGFDSDMGTNPIGRYIGLFMDGMLGPDYESGLGNLKALAESLPKDDFADLDAEVVTVEPANVAYITRTTSQDAGEIAAALGESYGAILGFLAGEGAQMAGAPISIHQSWEGDTYTFDAGMPFVGDLGELAEDAPVQVRETHGGKALKVVHLGSYHLLGETYDKAEAYIEAHGWELAGPAWDAYVDDPTTKPEAEVATHCYFPLAD
ncbi:MAG: SRPBCC family protein [Acidobacteriota bacterium]